MNSTWVRLEYGQQDRMSENFGPFEFAQITYTELRVMSVGADMDHTLAVMECDGVWEDMNGTRWSDIVIFSAE